MKWDQPYKMEKITVKKKEIHNIHFSTLNLQLLSPELISNT